MLISCSGIHKFYNGSHVLKSLSLTVENQDRIGLVGDNGCGKSTFLRILTEEELPDGYEREEPQIAKATGLRIGYLAQNAGLDGSKTVRAEMEDAFAPLLAAKADDKNPASVTPTWMVARKLPGLSMNLSTRRAFLSPSSASLCIFASLREMTAISVPEKKALTSTKNSTSKMSSNISIISFR